MEFIIRMAIQVLKKRPNLRSTLDEGNKKAKHSRTRSVFVGLTNALGLPMKI